MSEVHVYQAEKLLCVKKEKKGNDFFRTSNEFPTSSYSKANIKLPLSKGAFVRVYISRATSGLVLKTGR